MIFNSIEYLFFLPLVFSFYWLLRSNYKKQNILLLVSSYIFYGWWDWRFLSLIIFSSFVDYLSGLKIYSGNNQRSRRNWLLLSLFSNLGLLGTFKYFNFFIESFSDFMLVFGWKVDGVTLNIILPVGISFYTFQTMSYTIDIYRKKFQPTKDMVAFFTYVAFFPQLVAGPIERASNLLPQIMNTRSFSHKWFKDGFFQIIIGLFRKIVIADSLAIYVDRIYSNPEFYNSTTILLATFLYAFQIYYDFAGYSDIAIGSAKLLGFRFNQNFNIPYFSKSLTEFWRKWHMSLSFWLRDYLYISLGGNRKGIRMTYVNLLITMLLGGLWHGSSWNFVIWGAIHGFVLSIEKFIFSKELKFLKRINILGYLLTFTIVLFSWIFFRAQNLEIAVISIKKIFEFDFSSPFIGDITVVSNAVLMLFLGLLLDLFLFIKKIDLENFGNRFSNLGLILITSLVVIIISLFHSTSINFIYFQF